MKIIGCDLHARQQTIAMLDTDTGELEAQFPDNCREKGFITIYPTMGQGQDFERHLHGATTLSRVKF